MMLDKSWMEEGSDRVESFNKELTSDYSEGYYDGASDFQERLLQEIEKEIERYGTDQADVNLHDFKEMVLNLKA